MMKTNVVAHEPISSIYNSHLGKYQLSQKLENRLSIWNKQKTLSIKSQHSFALKKWQTGLFCSTSKSATKKRANLFDENVTRIQFEAFIDVAMKLQQNASDTGRATNRTYELQLLFIFLHTFMATIFQTYNMFIFFTKLKGNSDTFQKEWINDLFVHLIQPILYVVVTVLSFTNLTNEFRKSQIIVNKIIIHAGEKDIRTKFSEFSQQIQSNIPQFNVFGFFNLDGSCIFSMISSTTTYLIILAQSMGNNVDGPISTNATPANETEFLD